MWSKYDENINNNPFYTELSTNHFDIIRKCSTENWTICVPRIGTIEDDRITINTILDHILIPYKNHEYSTLNKKHIKVENGRINFAHSEELFETSVEILFEETYYIEGNSKYIIWCIDSPLFSDTSTLCTGKIQTLESLHDCIDFLWMESLGHGILDQIQSKCTAFLQHYSTFETESFQMQKDLFGSLFSQCLHTALQNTHLNKKCEQIEFFNKLKVAIETFMQHSMGNKLICSINTVTCTVDSHFNKITRNSQHVDTRDFQICNKLHDLLQYGKCELAKINCFQTVLDKINCLKRTISIFQSNQHNHHLTSDDILQILVYLIVKINIPNWISNLLFVKEFSFSLSEYSDENNYFITSFEAAIEYIKSKQFSHTKRTVGSLTNTFNDINSYGLNILYKQTNINKNIIKNLCHPLCTCTNCETLIKQTDNNNHSSIATVCNEFGQNFLTCAVILENRQVIEQLLKDNKHPIDTIDYYNRTALHYACLNGSQDILLLLISHGANVNCLDNDKNSPLHLACNNGHYNCVNALIYATRNLEMEAINEFGDTPLHLATKWAHHSITNLLLQHNANKTIRNHRNKTAFDFALNYHMKKLFKDDSKANDVEKPVSVISSETFRPKTADQFKKIDLLLKAIENNDLPLTCFHLGFNHNVMKTNSVQTTKKCHPLCDCAKCKDHESDEISIKRPLEHLNVNTCNRNGYTALHFAAKFNRLEIMRLLLDCCASTNVRTSRTLYTPLHLACIFQRIQSVQELLKCGECTIDAIDSNGNSPLYYACMKNDFRIVELLIANGADCNRRNNAGNTILQELHHTNMNYRIFKLLKNHSNLGTLQRNGNDADWLT